MQKCANPHYITHITTTIPENMMMMLMMITMNVWRPRLAWLHMNLAPMTHLKRHKLWNQAGCWRQTISYHLKCDAGKEACRCIATSSTMSSLSCSIRNGPANPKVTLAGACGCHHQVLRQCLFTLRGCSAFSSLTGYAIDLFFFVFLLALLKRTVGC